MNVGTARVLKEFWVALSLAVCSQLGPSEPKVMLHISPGVSTLQTAVAKPVFLTLAGDAGKLSNTLMEHSGCEFVLTVYPASERRVNSKETPIMIMTKTAETELSIRILEELLGEKGVPEVSIRLWNGEHWPDERPSLATIVLRHPGALRQMFLGGSEKVLGEAYLRDDFDVEGDMEAAFNVADALETRMGWKRAMELGVQLRRLPAWSPSDGVHHGRFHGWRHSRRRDRDAVQSHYDVSNDFFALWLDARRVYSCAYFRNANETLDEAQTDKLEWLCRKLRLRKGQRVLDVGCGWGGFALYAAERYGVEVTGITLSRRQAEFAQDEIVRRGLKDRVNVVLKDYREMKGAGPFDAVVSVGMAEHVGERRLPEYFGTIYGLLRPGGLFLNHAIGEGVRKKQARGPSFIDTYVFPDGEIPPIAVMLGEAELAGFEVRDVENLREHYALTLRHWVRRLEARHDEAMTHVDEKIYRIWRLYMAGSAHGFARANLAVYQSLLGKPDVKGRVDIPMTREDLYD